jgi:hypothetical protein
MNNEILVVQQGLEIRGFWFQIKTVQLKTEGDFFSKNSVTSRLQCISRLLLCSIVYSVIQGHSILSV